MRIIQNNLGSIDRDAPTVRFELLYSSIRFQSIYFPDVLDSPKSHFLVAYFIGRSKVIDWKPQTKHVIFEGFYAHTKQFTPNFFFRRIKYYSTRDYFCHSQPMPCSELKISRHTRWRTLLFNANGTVTTLDWFYSNKESVDIQLLSSETDNKPKSLRKKSGPLEKEDSVAKIASNSHNLKLYKLVLC